MIGEKFCVGYAKSFLYDRGEILHRVRKILPIYRGMLHCVGVRYFPTASPLFIGEVQRTPTQNFYIQRKTNPISVKLYITMCVFVCASVNALSMCVLCSCCLSVCLCVRACVFVQVYVVCVFLSCFVLFVTLFMCDNTINELIIF